MFSHALVLVIFVNARYDYESCRLNFLVEDSVCAFIVGGRWLQLFLA